MTHLSTTTNIPTKIETKQNLKVSSMTWWLNQILNKDVVDVPSVRNLGNEASIEKNLLLEQNIESIIDFPMIFEDRVIGFLGMASDKISRKWSKEEVFLLQVASQIFTNALQRKSAERKLHEARIKAEKAATVKSEFLAHMSHEIRTPLNAVLGQTQLLEQDKSLSDQQQKRLESIGKNGKHLLSLINNVLDMAKMEAGKIEKNPVRFNIKEEINGLVEMMRSEVKNGLQITIKIEEKMPDLIVADKMRTRQVLLNLLSNAIKFTHQGEVVISAKTNESTVFISIADTGMGISKDEINRIFEPFEQGKKNQTKFEGTGLGLSISKQLALLMGGDLTVKSELGNGSEFTFSFSYSLPHEKEVLAPRKNQHDSMRQLKSLSSQTKAFESLCHIPGKIKHDLKGALEIGDLESINHFISEISEIDQPIANQLILLAEEFNYTAMKKILSISL